MHYFIARYIMLKFLFNERGQGLVEYALMILLIALVIIIALSLLGVELGNTFNTIDNSVF